MEPPSRVLHDVHDVPLKLSTLRAGVESGFQRQLDAARRDFERNLEERGRAAEEAAHRKAETLLAPQVQALHVRLQAESGASLRRSEAAEARLIAAERKAEQQADELAQLRRRMDAVEARLDTEEAQSSAATADRDSLRTGLSSLGDELAERSNLAETRRSNTELSLRSLVHQTAANAQEARGTLAKEMENHVQDLLSQINACESRFAQKLQDEAKALRGETSVGDSRVSAQLRQELKQAAEAAHAALSQSHAEMEQHVAATAESLRGHAAQQADAAARSADAALQARSSELHKELSQHHEAAIAHTDGASHRHEKASTQMRELLDQNLTEVRLGWCSQLDSVRAQLAETDLRLSQAVDAAEQLAASSLAQRMEGAEGKLTEAIRRTEQALNERAEHSAGEMARQLKALEERAGHACDGARLHAASDAQQAVLKAMGQQRADLEDALSEMRRSIEKALHDEREEGMKFRSRIEQSCTTVTDRRTQAVAADANTVSMLQELNGRLQAELAEVRRSAKSSEQNAVDMNSQVHREIVDIRGEIAHLSSSVTALSRGMLKALHIIGLVGDESWPSTATKPTDAGDPPASATAGVEALAAQVGEGWMSFQGGAQPAASILALIDRKAERLELTAFVSTLREERRADRNETLDRLSRGVQFSAGLVPKPPPPRTAAAALDTVSSSLPSPAAPTLPTPRGVAGGALRGLHAQELGTLRLPRFDIAG